MNYHEALAEIQEDTTKVARCTVMNENEGIIWLEGQAIWFPMLDSEPFPYKDNDEFLESEWEIFNLKDFKESHILLV